MFDKLISLLKIKEKIPFDASIFNDPLAQQVEWTPLASGGANFKTHNLVQTSVNRMEFKAGKFMKVFAGIFMLFGLTFATLIPFVIFRQPEVNYWIMILPVSFGSIFAVIGYFIYRTAACPRVFDKSTGFYWKGREEPNQMINAEYQKYTKLNDIHALQIISEHVRGNKSSYTSYELNLIMKDRSRINIVDHGNINALRSDAIILSQFINVPVWDATEVRSS